MSMIMNLLGFSQRSRSSELTSQKIEAISSGSVYRSYVQGPEFVGVVSDAGYASRDPDTGLIVVMGNFSPRQVSLYTSRFVLRVMEKARARLGEEIGYRIRVEMGSNTPPQRVREILQGMVSER